MQLHIGMESAFKTVNLRYPIIKIFFYLLINSWPSIAYVKFNYRATYKVSSGNSVTYSFSGACGGKLIDFKACKIVNGQFY